MDAKLTMAKYPHLAMFIALTRDRDPGRVYADPTTGEPRLQYTPSPFDRAHTIEGVQALAKLCYVTGATQIRPHIAGLEPFDVPPAPRKTDGKPGADPEFADEAFGRWLGRLRGLGNKPPASIWSSAHQMGTCRMSGTAEDGVVDGRGRVWGAEGLYVADASVFPSASGVNPMVTTMALADVISRGVAKEMETEGM